MKSRKREREHARCSCSKGTTACYLLRHTYRVRKGDVVVVHRGGGGVGSCSASGAARWARRSAVSWAARRRRGSRRETERGTADPRRDDLVASVRKIGKGEGAHVVYDAGGKDTFTESLDCLRRRGMLVL